MFDHCKKKMFNRNIFVTKRLQFILCTYQHFVQICADIWLSALHFGSFLKRLLYTAGKGLFIDSHLFDQLQNQTVLYGQQTIQQMFLRNFLVTIIICDFLTAIHCFNRFLCKFLYIHDIPFSAFFLKNLHLLCLFYTKCNIVFGKINIQIIKDS